MIRSGRNQLSNGIGGTVSTRVCADDEISCVPGETSGKCPLSGRRGYDGRPNCWIGGRTIKCSVSGVPEEGESRPCESDPVSIINTVTVWIGDDRSRDGRSEYGCGGGGCVVCDVCLVLGAEYLGGVRNHRVVGG